MILTYWSISWAKFVMWEKKQVSFGTEHCLSVLSICFEECGFLLFVTGQRTIFDSVNIWSVWPWQQAVWALQQGRKVMVFVVTDFSYDFCGSQCLHKKSKLTVFIWQFSLMPHAGGNTGWWSSWKARWGWATCCPGDHYCICAVCFIDLSEKCRLAVIFDRC